MGADMGMLQSNAVLPRRTRCSVLATKRTPGDTETTHANTTTKGADSDTTNTDTDTTHTDTNTAKVEPIERSIPLQAQARRSLENWTRFRRRRRVVLHQRPSQGQCTVLHC